MVLYTIKLAQNLDSSDRDSRQGIKFRYSKIKQKETNRSNQQTTYKLSYEIKFAEASFIHLKSSIKLRDICRWEKTQRSLPLRGGYRWPSIKSNTRAFLLLISHVNGKVQGPPKRARDYPTDTYNKTPTRRKMRFLFKTLQFLHFDFRFF